MPAPVSVLVHYCKRSSSNEFLSIMDHYYCQWVSENADHIFPFTDQFYYKIWEYTNQNPLFPTISFQFITAGDWNSLTTELHSQSKQETVLCTADHASPFCYELGRQMIHTTDVKAEVLRGHKTEPQLPGGGSKG